MRDVKMKSYFSDDYHDYVIKDGKFIGKFEEMYKYSKDVPWHQDRIAYAFQSDIDIGLLWHIVREYEPMKIAEIGCGLGYFTTRFYDEVISIKRKEGRK